MCLCFVFCIEVQDDEILSVKIMKNVQSYFLHYTENIESCGYTFGIELT